MTRYIASYDLTKGHSEFLAAALDEGWTYVFPVSGELFRLPNTTLWGNFADRTAAQAAFTRALDAAQMELGRRCKRTKSIIGPLPQGARVLSDVKKATEPEYTVEGDDFTTCRLHQLHDEFFSEES